MHKNMAKRSRYQHVQHVGAGVYEITAGGSVYFASLIRGWFTTQVENKHNPEIIDCSITFQTPSSIFTVKCTDLDEMIMIMNEITVQGI